jgi:hypothetical protein
MRPGASSHLARRRLQDDFAEWPPRLIVRTDDAALAVSDVLPPAIAALLLRSTKLRSGLEVLDFDGMEQLRLIASRLRDNLGERALASCVIVCVQV